MNSDKQKKCMRIPVIAGNWKMNNTIEESLELVRSLHAKLGDRQSSLVEIVVAPSFVALAKVATYLRENNSPIKAAAQDLFWEDSGAYTGATSGKMIRDAGAEYVIIGHSERRQYFGESDANVNKKVKAALHAELLPIVCVGETLSEREANQVEAVVARQLLAGLSDIDVEQLARLIIAYEPVWAIGTGKTASPQQAEEVHAFIRKTLREHFGVEVAAKMRILYGGSVKPDNSKELLSQDNIDGALVGGASLKAADFTGIITSAL